MSSCHAIIMFSKAFSTFIVLLLKANKASPSTIKELLFMVIPFPHHPTKLPKTPRICHSLHHRCEKVFVILLAKASPIEPIAILGKVQVGMLFADAVIRAVDHTFHI